MATFSISLTTTGVSASKSLTPSDAATLEYLDDLIARRYEGMTQQQAADALLDDIVSRLKSDAKSLERDRLALAATGIG